MIDTSSSTGHRLGYLLLRDGHAIPLRGISPDEIKEGAKHRVLHPNAAPLPHRHSLNAIVDRLGFPGDFGTFKSTGWAEFQRYLKYHKCTYRAGVFPVDHGGCIDLDFTAHSGPTPRQLADRIFEARLSVPKRVFLGYGVDWLAWDNGDGIHAPPDAINSMKVDPEQATKLAQLLFTQRLNLMGQWGFLDDKLIHDELHKIVDKTYWAPGFDPEEQKNSRTKIVAAVRAFRAVFNNQLEGWVDILRFNDRLVVLRAHDGCWDLLWRGYRDGEPPKASNIAKADEIAIERMPSALKTKSDHQRAIYFRQEAWEEREGHLAEQAFYDRGGSIQERQLTNSTDVRIAWLKEQSMWPETERKQWEGPLPNGFHAAVVNGRKIAISDIIDVRSFSQMLIEIRQGEKRTDDQEPWERGNEGTSGNAPVTASWIDAQAYCAWKERQLGANVNLRLPTRKELRTIRPAYSKHYDSLALRDFPWENFPPRPIVSASEQASRQDIPSAVNWSEPRFVAPGPDVPEFPPNSGWSTNSSRKRWIKDFPPRSTWVNPIPWVEHEGLAFIDAWDAYEWCQEKGIVSGRFWEGLIAPTSWGAYKNMKVTFRVVMDLEG